MDCLFCAINDKTIPATIVYEDDTVLAFRDIAPQAPTHILVIPKKHISTLNDIEKIDEALLGHMVHTAKTLAAEEGLADNGYRLIMNCNGDSGQTVFHIHLHIVGGHRLQMSLG